MFDHDLINKLTLTYITDIVFFCSITENLRRYKLVEFRSIFKCFPIFNKFDASYCTHHQLRSNTITFEELNE